MKKIFMVFALFCAFFLVSCGSSDNNSAANMGKLGKECYPNETCDKGLRCDTDNNICVEDPENPINDSDRTDSGSDVEPDTGSDSDGGDSAPDSGDTAPDNGDTTSDGGDTAPDSGDTTPDEGDTADDSDNGDTASDNGDTTPDDDTDSVGPELNFPECSPTSETPCIDPNNLLVWSARSTVMLWSNAFEYCNNLDEGGYTDWRLPDLAILYTLVRNCSSQQNCPCIGDPCTPSCYFTSCSSNSEGYYSVFGETAFLWSSSAYGDSEALGVFFADGGIKNKSVINTMGNVRCVRIATTSATGICSEIPEHAVYNTASEITLTWDWTNYWPVSRLETTYDEEPSTTECRFKCEENYFWDSSTEECVISPCISNPCGEYSDVVCMAITPEEFSYDCINGYYWWGIEKGCIEKHPTFGNICTGQNKCYNDEEEITCPSSESDSFFGQDAQYAEIGICAPQSSFIASSNVVIDNNTGLTWEKSPSTSEYTWDNRATHCNGLNSSNYGGKSNWRVPNPLELLTIVNNSTYNPATNSNFTGMPTDSSVWLWTSAEYKGNTSNAYAFSPFDGWYYSDSSLFSKTKKYKVLCVSGDEMKPATSSDFTTSSDGNIVSDNRTGLMWQKNYPNSTTYTWVNALKYCEDLSYAGYTDWRLPNKNELASLVNYEKSGSPYSYFPDMPSKWFLSSSTYVYDTSYAWGVDFDDGGGVSYSYKTRDGYVRCVR